jgi:hypothetical protein
MPVGMSLSLVTPSICAVLLIPETSALTVAEAEQIVEEREGRGYLASVAVTSSDVGVFYIIQLVPDLDPNRIKLGFAESLDRRLSEHRTAAPTAQVLQAWPSRRTWEGTVIAALTRSGCSLIRNEVFLCDSLE